MTVEFDELPGLDDRARRAALAVRSTTGRLAVPVPPLRSAGRRWAPAGLAVGLAALALVVIGVARLAGDGHDTVVVPATGFAGHYRAGWLPPGLQQAATTDAQAVRAEQSRLTVVWDHTVPDPMQAPAAMALFTVPAGDADLRGFMTTPDSQPVTVQGMSGFMGGDGEGRRLLVFGPVAGGVVSVESSRLDTAEVLQLGEAVRVVDGRVAIDPAVAAARFRATVVDTARAMYLWTGGSGGPYPAVLYSDGRMPGGDQVTVMVADGAEGRAPLARIPLVGVTDATVAGAPGVVGEFSPLGGTFSGPRAFVAVAALGDRLVTVVGEGISRAATLRIAASLEPVDDTDWHSRVAGGGRAR
jgi:hypothetical protein